MSHDLRAAPARRIFLRQVGGVSGAALAIPALLGAGRQAPALAQTPGVANGASGAAAAGAGYLSLGPQEAACVKALVNVMCPADGLTPSGVDCGLDVFIDRQLAGSWGRGDRLYRQGPWLPGKPQQGAQTPLAPEDDFKAGLAALRRVVRERTGQDIAQLPAATLDALLLDVAAGKLDAPGTAPGHAPAYPLAAWFNDSFYPLFVQACFADPLYGGNRDKVFWRAVGYPGLPAFHGRNVVQYRGVRFPAAAQPRSIADFS